MPVKNMTLALVSAVALGVTLFASGGSGGSGGGGTTTTTTQLSLRIPNEMAPAGGLVQMKVLTTEVTPISGGRPGFGFDSMLTAAGFGMFASRDLAGAAVVDGPHVTVQYATNGAWTLAYPLLTVSLWVPDVAAGTKTLFNFDSDSIWNVTSSGPVYAKPIAPATVAVGGTASITDVVPGEGVWPAGTVVSVRGTGFSSRSQIKVNDAGIKFFSILSPNELQFTLTQTTQMRGLKITVQNPENTDTYYAYMRGLVYTVSSRTLLAATEPIFSLEPRTVSTFPAIDPLLGSQYQAVALQNPTASDVDVNVLLYAADGTLIMQGPRTLASRERLALEMSELLGGVAPFAGSFIMVTASAPIDAIGLLCDEGSWTVTPSLPLESPQ